MSHAELFARTAAIAAGYRDSLTGRPVGATASLTELRSLLAVPLGDEGVPPLQVIEELAAGAERGLIANAGPRYFGFVIGGSSPASVAADWLTSAWDQNSGLYATGPAQAVCEEVAAVWLAELLGLPKTASVGFVTGCQMANFTALAAARHEVLRRAGWNVEDDGLCGAPEVNVVAGEEAHVTIFRALRFLGMGNRKVARVPADAQGRMRVEELARVLERLRGPTIVCAQAGNVNSGSFDPLAEIAEAAHAHGAWLHVDGAFGLWAQASAIRRHLSRGAELADSWATDAHKWLNVPYDSGLVAVANPAAHRAAMAAVAPYLVQSPATARGVAEAAAAPAGRDAVDWVPEFSRRARGFALYAALRALGRSGVESLIDRSCDHAALFATLLRAGRGVEIVNQVVLNQVLVRFTPPSGDADAFTRAVIARAQASGQLWLAGSVWKSKAVARISVSGEATTSADVERSAAALLSAAAASS